MNTHTLFMWDNQYNIYRVHTILMYCRSISLIKVIFSCLTIAWGCIRLNSSYMYSSCHDDVWAQYCRCTCTQTTNVIPGTFISRYVILLFPSERECCRWVKEGGGRVFKTCTIGTCTLHVDQCTDYVLYTHVQDTKQLILNWFVSYHCILYGNGTKVHVHKALLAQFCLSKIVIWRAA